MYLPLAHRDTKKYLLVYMYRYCILISVGDRWVENGRDVKMKARMDRVRCEFKDLVFRKNNQVKNDQIKASNDDRVAQTKYGIVCYTKVNICNKEYTIRVSLYQLQS